MKTIMTNPSRSLSFRQRRRRYCAISTTSTEPRAGPKLPIASLGYRGVTLDSRWSVAAEFETMKAIVDALPDLVRVRVESIWCDSKAQACYTVAIAERRWAEGIEWDVRDAILGASHSFNGVFQSRAMAGTSISTPNGPATIMIIQKRWAETAAWHLRFCRSEPAAA